jgi:P4 family phage/plasmid primase-like protien
MTKSGAKDASCEHRIVDKWWEKNPRANIAIATGSTKSKLVVIDLDVKNGINGIESWVEFVKNSGIDNSTCRAFAGGGGQHIYFLTEDPVWTGVKLLPGVDVRADGGYIIAPPSIHASNNRYTWDEGHSILDHSPLVLPKAILELIEKKRSEKTSKPSGSVQSTHKQALRTDESNGAQILMVTGGERNVILTSVAGSMRRIGLGYDAIHQALAACNKTQCDPPLEQHEVTKIAKSICMYAPGVKKGSTSGKTTTQSPGRVANSGVETDGRQNDGAGNQRSTQNGGNGGGGSNGGNTSGGGGSSGGRGGQTGGRGGGNGGGGGGGAVPNQGTLTANPLFRGDSVELARKLLQDIQIEYKSPVPPISDTGDFWVWSEEKKHYIKVEAKTEALKMMTEWAGFPVMARNGTTALKLSLTAMDAAVNTALRTCEIVRSFDCPARQVPFRNGLLQIHEDGSRSFRPMTPEDRFGFCFQFDWDEKAECPSFKKFIEEVLSDPTKEWRNKEPETAEEAKQFSDWYDEAMSSVRTMQEFLGVCLIGEATRFQRCMFMKGRGANGKSVLIQIVKEAFPATAIDASPPASWEKRSNLASLDGKRMNLITELDEREMMDIATFRGVVDGSPIQVEHKFKSPFMMTPKAGHIFACNALPAVGDSSDAFWRRVITIHFRRAYLDAQGRRQHGHGDLDPKYIQEPDPNLIDKLRVEMPGIIRWMVEGGARVIQEGKIHINDASVRTRDEWRNESDSALQFITDRLLDADHERDITSGADLYAKYAEWCSQFGYSKFSGKKFFDRLSVRYRKIVKGMTYYACKLKIDKKPSMYEESQGVN